MGSLDRRQTLSPQRPPTVDSGGDGRYAGRGVHVIVEQDSTYISKGPCDECGSSDANARYTDGHTHCFSCGHHTPPEGEAPAAPKKKRLKFSPVTGDYMDLRKRRISEETCRKFGYFIAQHEEFGPVQVAN